MIANIRGLGPGNVTKTRPPIARTRRISRSAASLLGTNWSPIWQHEIERLVRKRHRLGTRLVPLDREIGRALRTGYRKHARVHVQAGNRASNADALCREPRHDSRSACDIKHALAWLKTRTPDEITGHRRTDRGDKKALVVLGRSACVGFASDLGGLSRVHRFIPFN
jgi:hypothetical protein